MPSEAIEVCASGLPGQVGRGQATERRVGAGRLCQHEASGSIFGWR